MLTLIALTLLYFLPSIAAYNKPKFLPIFLVNFFLGWTFIGWIVALVWALSTPAATAPQVIVVHPPAGGYCCRCGQPMHGAHVCGR